MPLEYLGNADGDVFRKARLARPKSSRESVREHPRTLNTALYIKIQIATLFQKQLDACSDGERALISSRYRTSDPRADASSPRGSLCRG